jgi:hypothetical protein
MSTVSGLFSIYDDSPACLVRDDELVAFIEGEELLCLKNPLRVFPVRAVKFRLQEAAVTLGEVYSILCPWNRGKYLVDSSLTLPGPQRYGGRYTSRRMIWTLPWMGLAPGRSRPGADFNGETFGSCLVSPLANVVPQLFESLAGFIFAGDVESPFLDIFKASGEAGSIRPC